jgi:hypothetical protein
MLVVRSEVTLTPSVPDGTSLVSVAYILLPAFSLVPMSTEDDHLAITGGTQCLDTGGRDVTVGVIHDTLTQTYEVRLLGSFARS